MIDMIKVNEYNSFVMKYMQDRLSHVFVEKEFMKICSGINFILLEWTGCTYIGHEKEKNIEQIYQNFFETVHRFLEFCYKNTEELSEKERTLTKWMMFQGTVYRYLGKADKGNYRKKIVVEPNYNNIYVSWSKSEHNSYIESKLCGPMTWMKAEILLPDFGIDIRGFEKWCEQWYDDSYSITRGKGREVVFPTIKQCIKEIKYIN